MGVSFLNIEFLGIALYDIAFLDLLIRGFFNFLISFLIIKFCYLKKDEFNDNAFSYFAFSLIVFFICHLMGNVELDIGLAFGLFAIFSILRYRTNSIPVREMTYFFVVMGISVVNALANEHVSLVELVFTNLAVFIFMFSLEKFRIFTIETTDEKLKKMEITHPNIDYIKPEDHEKLKEELKTITGVDIAYFTILKTDLVLKTAEIKIYYK